MAIRPRHQRATPMWSSRTRMRGAAAATSVLLIAGSGLMMPSAVLAAPAADPATSTFTTLGAFAGVVPAGVCDVRATVIGGAGGSAMSTTTVSPNGGGADVSATYAVLPGQPFSGLVGGGGQQPATNSQPGGVGGTTGGGAGGSSGDVSGTRHAGAGGGGYSQLTLGTDLAILAGGGGGSAGGHSETTEGVGGNAGLPVAAGVADGSDGAVGRDFPNSTVVTGGGGGGAAGGAGGTNSALADADGTAGASLQGGAGGADTNPDAGGGGGGGFFGGGGGASTVAYNTQSAGAVEISGAGGGGGSSFVAGTVDLGSETSAVSDIASTVGSRIAAGARGAGANGSVVLDWIPCAYDLAVSKSVSSATAPVGSTLGWTVSVENLGPDDMTMGDTVTIVDSLPGAGATKITGITVTGPSSPYFADAATTCNAQVGDAMPASLECSRPYQVRGEAASGRRGLNVGETLTVTYTQQVADAGGAVLKNTATVTDRTAGDANDQASATSTVLAGPTATDDSDLDNAIGETVAVSVLGNDTGSIVAGSVVLVNQSGSPVVGPYVVAGEGTWTVSGGVVTFVPQAGFVTDPTPVTYRVTDANGLTDEATVTVTYLPKANPDSDLGNTLGDAVTVDVLANDSGDFDSSTVAILDGGVPKGSLVVAGQGTWSVVAGSIRFTPEPGFVLDPTPVAYAVTDTTGDTVTSTVTVGYVPVAVDDARHGNVPGTAVSVDVLANDEGDFDPASVTIADPATGAPLTTLVVAGEGTWTVDPATGALTFAPQNGYRGNPTPVEYAVTDRTGDVVTATATVTYLPAAANDTSRGNRGGSPVTVDVVGNDTGVFDPASVRLTDPASGQPVTALTVERQGRWTVDAATGAITFTPAAGFTGDPTPVGYRITDVLGNTVTALVTITFVYPAAPAGLLAFTGADATLPLAGGGLLLVGGLGLLAAAAIRRRARG